MSSCIRLVELLSVFAFVGWTTPEAVPESQKTSPPEITGTVRDEEGRAIEDAIVLVHVANDPAKTDRTDREGRFSVPVEKPGPYSIYVEAVGFAPSTKERVETNAPLAIVLSRGITLEGVVRDGRTRQPVADAVVRTLAASALGPAVTDSGRGVANAMSDRQGRFRLEALARGPRTVWAVAPGYGRSEVRVSDGQGTVDVFLFPGSGVVGIVRGPDEKPIRSAAVRALRSGDPASWSRPGVIEKTDEQGRFALLGLPPGRYRVLVQHPEFAVQILPAVELTKGENVSVEVAVSQGAPISGRLVDEQGRPLQGEAKITSLAGTMVPLSGPAHDLLATRTGEDGRLHLAHVPRGEHELVLEPFGFAPQNLRVNVDDDSREVNLGDISFESGLTISGRVLNETGEPVADAEVSAYSQPSFITSVVEGETRPVKARSGRDGSFLLAGLGSGSHRVGASMHGYTQPENITVEAGASDVVITLERNGSLTGRVVDADGRPISSLTVTLEHRLEEGHRVTQRQFLQAEGGRFLIEGLSKDQYVLTVMAEGLKPASVFGIQVLPGITTELGNIVLRPGGVIRGTVVDSSTTPVPGATVTANPEPPGGATVSDAKGFFKFSGFEDGVVDIRVTHPDYAQASVMDVEVRSEAGPSEVEVRLKRGGRLEGFVRDRDGRGLAGRIVRTRAQPAQRDARQSVTTGADGHFLVERLPAGTQLVQLLSGEDNLRVTLQEKEAPIREDETTFVEFQSSEIHLFGRATKGGLPLSEAFVTVSPTSTIGGFWVSSSGRGASAGPLPMIAMTGPDGAYELLVDHAGEYTVHATASDGRTKFPTKQVVVPDVSSHLLDLSFDSITVTGRVVSGEVEEPVREGRVVVYRPTRPVSREASDARTDESGHFRLELEPGEYQLQVQAENYAPEERALTVGDATVPEVLIRLFKGKRLRGRVVDAEGRPPGVFYVHVTEDSQPTTEAPRFSEWGEVRPDGTFELRDLRGGNARYNVLAGSDLLGFAFAPGVRPEEGLFLRLHAAGWVDVVVRSPEGAAVPGSTVALAGLGGRKARAVAGQTDSRGRVALFVPTGDLELKAVKGVELEGVARVAVNEGERAFAEIRLRPVAVR